MVFEDDRLPAVSANPVALIPRCAECEAAWLATDENAGAPTCTDDLRAAELAFYCPECAEREFGDEGTRS